MCDVDEDILDTLRTKCFSMIENDFNNENYYNDRFQANLPKTFQVNPDHAKKIENYLNQVMPSYWNVWGQNSDKYSSIRIPDGDVWSLFQKEGEFVAPHHHFQRFSFVIWINLPYENKSVNSESPGSFNFMLPFSMSPLF
jgi:hypothetical protein